MLTKIKFFSVFISCLLIVGCSSQEPIAEVANEVEPTATIKATTTSIPTTTPTSPPTETPTPSALTPSEIFDQLSPAVAFIETSLGSGSGVLVDNGYLLTNAHVVWPFTTVRVVFPDGSEFVDAPIFNIDLMADLAIIGPIDTAIEPLPLVDGEDQVIGSDVYLLGYPGEVESFPQPTITRGLISRLREWETIGITYFQSDAAIAGGQSGGILISEDGNVIGISGFRFTEAGFALVASAADIQDRVTSLVADEDVSGLGDWRLPTDDRKNTFSVVLREEWDTAVFVIDEPVGTKVEIELNGGHEDGRFTILNAYGYPMEWGNANNPRVTSFAIEDVGPHFLYISKDTPFQRTYSLQSSHQLARLTEEKDELLLQIDKPISQAINFPGDIDEFQIYLEVGERVNIQVDSSLIDPYFSIFPDGLTLAEHSLSDDDSGGGVFGLNAEMTFEAPQTDFYTIIVESASAYEVGGYTITAAKPYEGAPTPIAPTATPQPFESEVGLMNLYENDAYQFSIEYPGEWTDVLPGHPYHDLCQQMDACFSSYMDASIVLIFVEDLANLGLEDLSMEEYIDLIKENQNDANFTILNQDELTTNSGQSATILEIELDESLNIARLIYAHGDVWINITYLIMPEYYEDTLPIIEYSFDTFKVER